MSIYDDLANQIDFAVMNTGKEPDALYLWRSDYGQFIDEISRRVYSTKPAWLFAAEDIKFRGIPVKEFQVVKYE